MDEARSRGLTSQQMTAALPPLSDDFMREFYAAVMAPPEPDLPALSPPPQPALPRPDILAELEQRVRQAQVQPPPSEPAQPVASTSTASAASTVIDGRAQLVGVLDSLEPIVREAEAVSSGRPVSVANVATLDEWLALAAQASEVGRSRDVVRILRLMQARPSVHRHP